MSRALSNAKHDGEARCKAKKRPAEALKKLQTPSKASKVNADLCKVMPAASSFSETTKLFACLICSTHKFVFFQKGGRILWYKEKAFVAFFQVWSLINIWHQVFVVTCLLVKSLQA